MFFVREKGLRLTLFTVFLACSGIAGAAPVEIRVNEGRLLGVSVDNQELFIFKGVPYAAAPTGSRRWEPPENRLPWQGVRSATNFAPDCSQLPYPENTPNYRVSPPQSEDCLYLNIWSPAVNPEQPLPVMLWIHGGGLSRGSGAEPVFDGSALAREGVVVVTVNYRLNVFGFLAHPQLSEESLNKASGNYGILDQIQALRWIRDNIRKFGGDPSRVTIFGGSAGSRSVNVLMATPLARGLFHRAIGQSSAQFSASVIQAEGELRGEAYVKSLNANTISAMRTLPAQLILNGYANWKGESLAEIIEDSWMLPGRLYNIFSKGQQADVPVIVGYNADEATSFLGSRMTQGGRSLAEIHRRNMGSLFSRFGGLYPVFDEPVKASLTAMRDGAFGWGMQNWASGMGSVSSKAYLYYFTKVPPVENGDLLGAYHGAEIPYVFGNMERVGWRPRSRDRRVSEAMMEYWVRFAATGNPNEADDDSWPDFTGRNRAYMNFGDRIEAKSDLHSDAMQFWNDYYREQREQGRTGRYGL